MSSLLRTVKAVAWAFIGVRKDSEYQKDIASLKPLQIIAVAIVGVVLLVAGLAALVHWVVQ